MTHDYSVPKFSTGRVDVSKPVVDEMEKDKEFESFVWASLGRHVRGDWGDIDAIDKEINDGSLKGLSKTVFSEYEHQGEVIYIITNLVDTKTEIMMAGEYDD